MLFVSMGAQALPVEKVLVQGTDTVRQLLPNGQTSGTPDRIIPGTKDVADFLVKAGPKFLAICEVEQFRTSLMNDEIVTLYSIANCVPYEWPKN